MNNINKRLTKENSAIVMIDLQDKLFKVIDNKENILKNNIILLQSAQEMGLDIVLTEQYPKGLGYTVEELKNVKIENIAILQKTSFSLCGENQQWIDEMKAKGKDTFILTGIESHICVYQTAKDLMSQGFNVYLVYDAMGSRKSENHYQILDTLRRLGAVVIPTETVLFEFLDTPENKSFKYVSKLIK